MKRDVTEFRHPKKPATFKGARIVGGRKFILVIMYYKYPLLIGKKQILTHGCPVVASFHQPPGEVAVAVAAAVARRDTRPFEFSLLPNSSGLRTYRLCDSLLTFSSAVALQSGQEEFGVESLEILLFKFIFRYAY